VTSPPSLAPFSSGASASVSATGQIGVLLERVEILVELLADLLGVLVRALLEVGVALAQEFGCLLGCGSGCPGSGF
jgi:hypothetical protein